MAEHPKESPAERDEHKGASGQPEADSAKILEKAAAEEKAAAQNVLAKAKAEKEHKEHDEKKEDKGHDEHGEHKEGGHARRKESGGSYWDKSYQAVRRSIFKVLTAASIIALPPIAGTAYLTKKAMDNTLGRLPVVSTAYNKTKDVVAYVPNKVADVAVGTATFPVSAIDRVEDVHERFVEHKTDIDSQGIVGQAMEHLWLGILYVPSQLWKGTKAVASTGLDVGKWGVTTTGELIKKLGHGLATRPIVTTLTAAAVIGAIAANGGSVIAASESLYKLGYGLVENLAVFIQKAALWLAK